MDARHSKSQNGFTLVELLVAMTLGLLMAGGVIALFVESGNNYSQDDEMSRIQENGRFAMQLLSREMAMAGFFGRYVNVDQSATTAITDIDQCGDDWALNISDHIEHNNDIAGDVTLYNGCVAADEQVAGTDVLVVKRVADEPSLEDGTVQSPATLNTNFVYLKSSNQGNDLSFVKGTSANFPVADQTAGSGVDAWQYFPTIFFIRNYSTTVGDGIPTLCRVVLLANGTMGLDTGGCLVEGVENLQIEYGIDSDSDGVPNQYTATPTDVDDVVSARIYVLIRSVNPVRNYTNDKTYNLGSVTDGPADDNFLRRVYSTTVSLRNPYNL
ncbi:prepilin-type N-terminal cleavage/methylation domain-containing protein [Pseudomaricurvus alkylphenolicus]|jgi:prepilin-type N-terminal cleavage/methylation domain-containing protein|uniref:PilW family protein n=1 Tax=Pseudomaricurvus alkylphenolicus TaxID=1306991 RepID=UPI001421F113|nr:PilW family protein [Pseudomaricurvus alkylphenolicus]NIB40244.1 prepilin-type N-terminal cleavage/methylation domain-containing protein [Pseudomaricurvus alkylphenolicus]